MGRKGRPRWWTLALQDNRDPNRTAELETPRVWRTQSNPSSTPFQSVIETDSSSRA